MTKNAWDEKKLLAKLFVEEIRVIIHPVRGGVNKKMANEFFKKVRTLLSEFIAAWRQPLSCFLSSIADVK